VVPWEVEIHVFSGRPDPVFALTEPEAVRSVGDVQGESRETMNAGTSVRSNVSPS
jgi:hypothetical protein